MKSLSRSRHRSEGTLSLGSGGYFGVPPLRPAREMPPIDPIPAALRARVAPLVVAAALCCVGFGWQGCSSVSSTAQRSGAVAVGGALGGITGHALSNGDPIATGGGAVAGAMLTHLGMGRDPAVLQDGFDQGYVRGQSDAIKRHYFLRQSLERRPLSYAGTEASTVTYLLPGPASTPDGIRLAPHVVGKAVRE